MDKHVIDCSAAPLCPFDSWKIAYHRRGSQITFDPAKIELYLADEQRYTNQDGQLRTHSINADELQKKLIEKQIINANVLDYLLNNKELIPLDWRYDEEGQARRIYFWGTTYFSSPGTERVRFLEYYNPSGWTRGNDVWRWDHVSISHRCLTSSEPAILWRS